MLGDAKHLPDRRTPLPPWEEVQLATVATYNFDGKR